MLHLVVCDEPASLLRILLQRNDSTYVLQPQLVQRAPSAAQTHPNDLPHSRIKSLLTTADKRSLASARFVQALFLGMPAPPRRRAARQWRKSTAILGSVLAFLCMVSGHETGVRPSRLALTSIHLPAAMCGSYVLNRVCCAALRRQCRLSPPQKPSRTTSTAVFLTAKPLPAARSSREAHTESRSRSMLCRQRKPTKRIGTRLCTFCTRIP